MGALETLWYFPGVLQPWMRLLGTMKVLDLWHMEVLSILSDLPNRPISQNPFLLRGIARHEVENPRRN
jgi:hypothetical protein